MLKGHLWLKFRYVQIRHYPLCKYHKPLNYINMEGQLWLKKWAKDSRFPGGIWHQFWYHTCMVTMVWCGYHMQIPPVCLPKIYHLWFHFLMRVSHPSLSPVPRHTQAMIPHDTTEQQQQEWHAILYPLYSPLEFHSIPICAAIVTARILSPCWSSIIIAGCVEIRLTAVSHFITTVMSRKHTGIVLFFPYVHVYAFRHIFTSVTDVWIAV